MCAWSVFDAENIAREVHKNQKRWNNSPYIKHPEAVAETILHVYTHSTKIAELQCIAWMHDVLEDSDDPEIEKKLRRQFPPEIVNAIKVLSREKGEDYFDFILRCAQNELARKVKIADISHNLIDLKPGSLRDKYLLARFILEKYEAGILQIMPCLP